MILFAVPLLFFVCTASAMMEKEEMHTVQRIMGSEIVSINRNETDRFVVYFAVLADGTDVSATLFTGEPFLRSIRVVHHTCTASGRYIMQSVTSSYYYVLKSLYEQQQGNAQ